MFLSNDTLSYHYITLFQSRKGQRLRIENMTQKQRSDQRDRNAQSQRSRIQIMTAQLRDLNRERNTQQQRIQRARKVQFTRRFAIVRDFSESEIKSALLWKFRCDLHLLPCTALFPENNHWTNSLHNAA